MRETKVRKRRIKWPDLLWAFNNSRIYSEYVGFIKDHPEMSRNRCAYYVLKKNYSTTLLRAWRDLYEKTGLDYSDIFTALKVNVYGL